MTQSIGLTLERALAILAEGERVFGETADAPLRAAAFAEVLRRRSRRDRRWIAAAAYLALDPLDQRRMQAALDVDGEHGEAA